MRGQRCPEREAASAHRDGVDVAANGAIFEVDVDNHLVV
jgi:hypothetical protein